MASGNSWQLYQELGGLPSSVFDALNDLPQDTNTSRRIRRRKSESLQISPNSNKAGYLNRYNMNMNGLKSSSSATSLDYLKGGYSTEKRDSNLKRHHSLSQPRIAQTSAPDNLRRKWQEKRRSLSFRIAKEKGRQFWHRAKTFLDINVLAGVIRSITPPPSPQSLSLSSKSSRRNLTADTETDDQYTTASDLQSEDDEYDFSNLQTDYTIQIPAEMDEPGYVELYQRRGRVRVQNYHADPNCPIHGTSHFHRSITERVTLSPNHQHIDDQLIKNRHFIKPPISTHLAIPGSRKVTRTTDGSLNADFMLKLARRRHKAILSIEDRIRMEREKSQIRRNLFTLSVAFLFLISAFQGLQNLQTTIHGQSGLGALSLCIVYSGLVISCLFTPPYFLNRIGCKLTLVMSICTFSIYILTHFIPKWYSLVPGSLLAGFGAASLWSAKCAYLSEIGLRYAELNLESSNVVIVRFFGMFFIIVHLGQVFGNVISSWLLRAAIGIPPDPVDTVDKTCGHFFLGLSHLSSTAESNLTRPSPNAIYSLCALYFCCTLLAALIIAMFLDQLKSDIRQQKEEPHFELGIWRTTIDHLRKPRHFFLIPLTIFNGMQQAFVAGEFTKAYVGCCLGIPTIGYVMTSFGMSDAFCSLVFGPLIKLFGRMPLLMFGAVVDMLMIFTLMIWPPNAADTALFYVIAACWGMADGVWNTQINGLWVVIFADNLAAAFANYRLWESVGFIIAFSYTPFLNIEIKLYILLTMLYVGMLGYGLIELWEPLEDYAVRLKKLHKKQSFVTKMTKRQESVDRNKEKMNGNLEVNEKLLDETAKSETKKAVITVLHETDF